MNGINVNMYFLHPQTKEVVRQWSHIFFVPSSSASDPTPTIHPALSILLHCPKRSHSPPFAAISSGSNHGDERLHAKRHRTCSRSDVKGKHACRRSRSTVRLSPERRLRGTWKYFLRVAQE